MKIRVILLDLLKVNTNPVLGVNSKPKRGLY